MSQHYFNVEIAKEYGLREAIVIQSLGYWLEKNIRDKRNFKEGRAWTFNSVKDMQKYFPYFTEKVLYNILRSLAQQGLIIKGNFNKIGYDKTTWYSLSELGEKLLGIDVHSIPTQELEEASVIAEASEEWENGISEMGKSNISVDRMEKINGQDGVGQTEAPIPVIETVKETKKKEVIENSLQKSKETVKQFPLKPGCVKLTLEEFKEKCPITFRSSFNHIGNDDFKKNFNPNSVTQAQQNAIEAKLEMRLKSGELQLPLDIIEFEKKVKKDPTLLILPKEEEVEQREEVEFYEE